MTSIGGIYFTVLLFLGFCRVRLNIFDENHFSECAQSILDKVDLEENAKVNQFVIKIELNPE